MVPFSCNCPQARKDRYRGGDEVRIGPKQTSLPPSIQAYLSKQGFGSGDNCLDFPLR